MLSSLKRPAAVLAAALVLVASNASAQGINLFPPSQAKNPDGEDPRNRRREAPDYRQYEYGKEVFAVKLGCQGCPLGDKPLDEKVAQKFLNDPSYWTELSSKEEDAVKIYLKQLYALP